MEGGDGAMTVVGFVVACYLSFEFGRLSFLMSYTMQRRSLHMHVHVHVCIHLCNCICILELGSCG